MLVEFNEENKELKFINGISVYYKRRKFESVSNLTVGTINKIFENNEVEANKYLDLLNNIDTFFKNTNFVNMSEEKTSSMLNKFESIINKYISGEFLVNTIHDHIERVYINIDENEEVSVKHEEIKFLNSHNKVILKTSTMYKLLVPLIIKPLEFYSKFNKNNKYEETIYNIFINCIKIFEEENHNIINKIHNLIKVRVKGTLYSNKVIWNYLQNLSIDENIMTNNIRKMIIMDIIIKLREEENVIVFLSSVINYQIDFQFTKKFNHSYKPVHINNNDPEIENIFDLLDQNNNDNNEFNSLVVNNDIEFTISRIYREIFGENHEELEYYIDNLKINNLQMNISFLMISHLTNIPYNLLNYMNKTNYVKSVLITYTLLKKRKNQLLADIILSDMIQVDRKKTLNVVFINNILDKYSYKLIVNKRYSDMNNRIIDNNFIFNKIKHMIQYKYNKINTFDNYKVDGVIYNHELTEYDKNYISEAYCQFILFIS